MRRESPCRAVLTTALLSTLLAGCAREVPEPLSGGHPPVVIISIDTLRADRLPAYGYGDVRTPAIDRLVSDSVLFENAYSQVPLTLPSHVSILTGKRPNVHGVRNNLGYIYSPDKHEPVSRLLEGVGYDTGAAVSAYALRRDTGLADAFEFYDDGIALESGVGMGDLQRPGTITLEVARRWIGEHSSRPFFFLFHIYEPHEPWAAPEPFGTQYEDAYDGEVAAADDVVGRLLDELRSLGLYESSVVVLLSDHGEGLGDHGETGHGVFLYREAIHVPLVVKLPQRERAGERVAAVVELTDVASMVAALAGTSPPAGASGRNILDPETLEEGIAAYSETYYARLHHGWSELRSLVDERHHYIEAPRPELYDVVADPAEKVNVIEMERRVYASLRRKLDGIEKAFDGPGQVAPEEAEKLAALGYIGSLSQVDEEYPDPKDMIEDFDVVARSQSLAREGDLPVAIAVLRDLLERNPRHADAWFFLGSNLEAMDLDADAVAAYQAGLRAAPRVVDEFALAIAKLLLSLNRLNDAADHARLVIERDPLGAHLMLARIAIAHGDLETAESEIDRAPDSDVVSKLRLAVVLARIREGQGRLDEGIGLLANARSDSIDRKIRVEDLNLVMGDLHLGKGEVVAAEAAYRREVKLFMRNLEGYAALAKLLGNTSRKREAGKVLDEMIETNPNPRAMGIAADVWDDLGENVRASDLRERADAIRGG